MEENDFNAEIRIQQIFDCLNHPEDAISEKLITSLQNDPSPIVRHEAAYILGEISAHQSASAALARAITADLNRFVIHEAMLALANRGDIEYLPMIDANLSNVDPDLASTAEIAKQRMLMKSSHQTLNSLGIESSSCILDQSSLKEHRIQAVFKILDDGSNESISLLIKALFTETDPIVKHEIIFALGETASARSIQPLLDTLQFDSNHFVIHETLLALATLGFSKVKNILRSFLNHPVTEIAESAEIALYRLSS